MTPTLARSRILRGLYTILGLVSLGLGFVGVWVPGIPAFDFILLAAFLFAMGNERLHRWILNHRWFGPMIRDYQSGNGFTRRMKITGVVAVALSFSLTIGLTVGNVYLALAMGVLGLAICTYIVTRPTKEPAPA